MRTSGENMMLPYQDEYSRLKGRIAAMKGKHAHRATAQSLVLLQPRRAGDKMRTSG